MRRLRILALAFALPSLLVVTLSARADEAPPPVTPADPPPPVAPSAPPSTPAPAPVVNETGGSSFAGGAPTPHMAEGFTFGSYGRVIAASDLRGGTGARSNIVAFGTRIDESTYAELQLERHDHYGASYGEGIHTRVVSTLAIAGPLFHETGAFAANIAVRNLFVEASGVFFKGFSAWGGSRMYRGDDIYVLDWWPLDNLNTVGGGIRLAFDTTSPEATTFALHAGLGRPLDPFSFQTRPSPSPSGFGSTDVVTLDRPRLIVSWKAQHVHLLGKGEGAIPGVKVALYGESHSISRGTRTLAESNTTESLPQDAGSVFGVQLGAFTGRRDTFVNIFLRYATGIAAFGDKTTPTALSVDKTADGAHEIRAAISANYEVGPFGILLGGYLRGFRDASGNAYSRDTFNEGTLVVRPQFWFGEHVGLAVEGSYQSLSLAGVDQNGNPTRAKVWRWGVIPFLTPGGRGSFTRPHLRVIYAYTARNDDARALYAPDDRFARRSNEHYLGLGVEWWFNSSYR
jgi:maltoporin